MKFEVRYGDDLDTLASESLGERKTYRDHQGRLWVYAEIVSSGDTVIDGIMAGGRFFEHAQKMLDIEQRTGKDFPVFGTNCTGIPDTFDSEHQLQRFLDTVALPSERRGPTTF